MAYRGWRLVYVAMYWLKLIFFILWLTGSPHEGNAFESGGDAPSLHLTVTVHIKEDADASKKDPHPFEQARLVPRLTKRKLDASVLSCATQNVSPSITSNPFSRFYHSYIVGEDDLISLYRFLGVYRC